jgi:hypothetical protein
MVKNVSDKTDVKISTSRAGIAKTWVADFRGFEMPQIPAVHPKITEEVAKEHSETSYTASFSELHKELRSGNAAEQKIWLIIALCSAAMISYSVYYFLGGH